MFRFALFAAAALLLPAQAAAAVLVGVEGYAYDTGSSAANVDEAMNRIAGRTEDARFSVTTLDYPSGRKDVSSRDLLSELLGADAGTIRGTDIVLETSVIVFRGQIDLVGGVQNYSVGSDDGFALFIDGSEAARRSAPRSFSDTAFSGDFGMGLKTFELVYYENYGRTGVRFAVNGEAAEVRATPIPGALPVMATGLAALFGLRRRRRA